MGRLGGRRHRFEQRGDEAPAAGAGRRADAGEPAGTGPAAVRLVATRRRVRPDGPVIARSGASESLVTSPAQTRSHSAASSSASVAPGAAAAQLVPEARPALGRARPGSRRAARPRGGSSALPARRQQRQLVGEAQPHPAVARPDRPGADPHHLAGRAQLVELALAVVRRPGRRARRSRASTRRAARRPAAPSASTTRVDAAARRRDAVPRREEAGQRLLLDRLDLAAQRGQRAAAQLAQHVDVAPLAADAVGAELAAHDAPVGLERRRARRRHAARGRRAGATTSRSTNGPWVRA